MDLNFNEEQQLLADGVARYLEQERDLRTRQEQLAKGVTLAPSVWRHFADQDLLALPRSESAGGMGGSIVDVVAIAMRFGAALLTEPYLATVVLAGAALETSGSEVAAALLGRIATGDAIVGFGHEEASGGAAASAIETTAVAVDGGYVLNGTKPVVLAAGDAERVVVTARCEGKTALFLVDLASDGVTVEPYLTVDGRGAGRLRLSDAAATPLLLDAGTALDEIATDASIYLAAESVGAMEALFRMTVSYATTRKQFGTPIAGFQTVAHRLADMKIALTKAHATLVYVTALREAGRAGSSDISALKAQTGRLGRALAEAAVQTHGGVGMTDELAVGHLLKRIIVNDALFGTSEVHLRRLGS